MSDDDLDLAQSAAVHYGISTSDKQRQIEARLGSFNEYPPNMEEITQSHFLWLWSISPASRIYQYRQALRQKGAENPSWQDRKMQELHFWILPDYSGLGWISHYDGKATRSKVDAYTCTYFTFVYCEHEYETISTANCYWEGRCVKCGYTKAVDSSG